jgi:hypothetical protein
MWLLAIPWGALIQAAGIVAAIFLAVRIVHDLVTEHRARRLNS